jgi:hypothetical protein
MKKINATRTGAFGCRAFVSLALLVLAFVSRSGVAATCTPPAPGVMNDAAFQTMLNNCAGQTITFASGTYRFVPSTTYAVGFKIPAGTTLQGAGNSSSPHPTIFDIADTGAYQALLWVRDVSHVTIEDIAFEGVDLTANPQTAYSSGCQQGLEYGHAIWVYSSPGATASVESVTIQDNSFHNFNGSSWITVQSADTDPTLGPSAGVGLHTEIAISQNTFYSTTIPTAIGGCIGSLTPGPSGQGGYSAFMISVMGNTKDKTYGFVHNVSISSNNPMTASYVEGAVAIWSNVSQVSVQYNTITGAGNSLPAVTTQPIPGSTSPPFEPHRYGVLTYDASHGTALGPDTIWIVGNSISNPESCGIYSAGATNLDINSNTISGQTDPWDATLPKGAISLNDSTTMAGNPILNNNLPTNYTGLAIAGGNIVTSTNTINVPGTIVAPSGTTGSFGIKLTSVPGGGVAGTYQIQGIKINTSATSNATSVVGYGSAGSASFFGVAQSGWTVTGGANPALTWYTARNGTEYGSLINGAVPNWTFGNSNVPLTADGVVQTASWHP